MSGQYLYDNQPIIACSTGRESNTAIALIRISGLEDPSQLKCFFSKDISNLQARYAYYLDIVEGSNKLDSIVLTYFKAPNSYNGENILELSVHGNQLNIERILNLFVKKAGLRLAKPGEFTYRALKNKKLSLAQVEGLDLLLNANSNLMLDQGLQTLQGELYQKYLALQESFIKLKASVELAIDFSEDVGEEQSTEMRKKSYKSLLKGIESLNRRIQGNVNSLTSPDITLVGQTNAGKSSLFNILLKNNRSIVSNIAGTTRDYVSDLLFLNGVNYRLVDTAGIRETSDVIEEEGIKRSLSLIEDSFFKILLINPFESNPEYFKKLEKIEFDLVVFTHKDTDGFIDKRNELLAHIPEHKDALNLSLVESVDDNQILEIITEKYHLLTKDNPILIDRHRKVIEDVYHRVVEFGELTDNVFDMAIISSELNGLGHTISELIGIVSPDEVLNDIFSNFCIGK